MEPAAPSPLGWRQHLRAVVRITVVAVVLSEVITFLLLRALLGEVLVEGLWIALICSAPISATIADRQIRMRHMISRQRDRLSELNRTLEARNADLDAFARAVAHDLKNPLSAVVGTATVLLDEPEPAASDHIKSDIQSILECSNQAVEIIDGLLLLHGIQHDTHDRAPVDTNATVTAALAGLTQAIAETETVVTRSEALPPVLAHAPWLTEVWINLIGNAIKYGGSPPCVEISARDESDGMVRFEVRDNGAGIAPEDRARIFDEFQRGTDAGGEGHGLGLAIVNRIVGRLGGEVGVDDGDRRGTIFWFTLIAA